MFPVRDDEPQYALLSDKETQDFNRYDNPIQLIPDDEGQVSLRINGDEGIGPNPHRNKQHAFHFTADNCIGCHACEAACSEKNDLPAHLSFRSVGYVEGGSFPNFTRMNISMACNHCDDPVCLKGCPTRAYTKHAEFGAVIQDPDICFGCGYCTWVCPYNAPQLDPVQGHVEKCNMCVDRLEVGLKPACVSACLGNALNFGVVENTPEGRDQISTEIPGFPTTDITKPNIRFQQVKSMPREVKRTDSMPIKYVKDNDSGKYKPTVDKKEGTKKYWNLGRLSSRENPIVLFTLATQAAIGAFLILFLGPIFGLNATEGLQQSAMYFPVTALLAGLVIAGLILSTLHLGKPHRFYRGFNNLRHSPVSREGLGICIFLTCLCGYAGLAMLDNSVFNDIFVALFATSFYDLFEASWLAWIDAELIGHLQLAIGGLTLITGVLCLYLMHNIYRIKARPFWNHWQVLSTFYGSMFSLGALLVGLIFVPTLMINSTDTTALLTLIAFSMALGMTIEGIGFYCHARDMASAEHEGAASQYIQTTTFGKTYLARNALMLVNFALVVVLGFTEAAGITGLILWSLLALSVMSTSLIGRALFYVLVIPTTMPGAFFWRNKGFEQHARDIGLANMPQVGVVPDTH